MVATIVSDLRRERSMADAIWQIYHDARYPWRMPREKADKICAMKIVAM